MSVSRFGLVAVIALGVLGVRATRADACECPAPPPAAGRLATLSAVFEGYVLDAPLDGSGATRTIHYQVLRAWKGVHADSVVAVSTGSSDASCGIDVAVRTKELVYASQDQGQLYTSFCDGSHASDQDIGDFAALGAPIETGTLAPGALSAPASPMSSSAGGCRVGGSAGPSAVGAALLALMLLGRRRR